MLVFELSCVSAVVGTDVSLIISWYAMLSGV